MTDQGHAWTDVSVAVILGISAIATAWCGYQAVRWSGRQAAGYSEADKMRAAANRASSLANHARAIDLEMFSSWLRATAEKRAELAEFYHRRFRPAFRVAFDPWIALKPHLNQSAPLSPFEMPEYHLSREEEIARFSTAAASATGDASRRTSRPTVTNC